MRVLWTRAPAHSSVVRMALLLSLGLLFVWGFTACDQTDEGALTPSPVTTAPAPTSTSDGGLPKLAPEKRWHTVLELGNTTGSVQNVSGSFMASKPYTIFFTCRGSGQIHVAYGTTTQTAPYTTTPEVNGAHSLPITNGSQQIQVRVRTAGQATWSLLVETQD